MSPINNDNAASLVQVEAHTDTTHISHFDEMCYFNKKMHESFMEGQLPKEFEPYFKWKFVIQDIKVLTEDSAYQMRNLATDLLENYYDKHPEAFSNIEFYHYDPQSYDIEESIWCTYKGFKRDMYIVSYLEKIDEELSELIASGILS